MNAQILNFLKNSSHLKSLCFRSYRTYSISSALFDSDRKYTKKHEWVSVKNNIGTIGITTFAQEALGDIVYVELPENERHLSQGEVVGAIESVKAASDIYAPVSGLVKEKNAELTDKPHLINKSSYDKGWLYKCELSNNLELQDLLNEKAYKEFCLQEQSEE